MPVTDTSLKELKGYILELTNTAVDAINDDNKLVLSLCQLIENIFRKGLVCVSYSPFGMTKRDYWTWIEQTSRGIFCVPGSFRHIVDTVISSSHVLTSQGRGRLFIRYALQLKCIHVPVEAYVRHRLNVNCYNATSIIGDEILGEILLSLLCQIGNLNFNLKLENASFLDDTWQLPVMEQFELVPCDDLGIHLGHVAGHAVVIRVDENSVAGEDNKIEVCDVMDEICGECIRGWRASRVSALVRAKRGMPISLKLLKGHYVNGLMFPGVKSLLRRLHVDVDALQTQFFKSQTSEIEETSLSETPVGSQSVHFMGSVAVGEFGNVSLIERAVKLVVDRCNRLVSVIFLAGEIGVRVLIESDKKVLFTHNYTKISSCGRRNEWPIYFAYIAGETSCNLASEFTCFVFKAQNENQCRDILLTLADGFHRTHWAV